MVNRTQTLVAIVLLTLRAKAHLHMKGYTMYTEQNMISDEMGSNYCTISSAWDSDNNYSTNNVALEEELTLLDARIIYNSISFSNNKLAIAGDEVIFNKSGNSYAPTLRGMKLRMNYKLCIASYLIKHMEHIQAPDHEKEWSVYHVLYKDIPFTVGVLNDGKACFFNKLSDKDKLEAYYKFQRSQKTRHTETSLANFEYDDDKSLDYYGDKYTSFPYQIDTMEDKLDDAIDLIMQASTVPELAHKIDELKELLSCNSMQ